MRVAGGKNSGHAGAMRSIGRDVSPTIQLDGEMSNEILAQVGERDSALVESIRQKMFVFDDLMMIDANGVKALASLPSLDQLRAKIVGLIAAPATKIAQLMNAPGAQLARVVQAYANKS